MRSEEQQTQQPVLILVSDGPDLNADVRSKARHVRRWTSDEAEGADVFSGDPADPRSFEWARSAPAVTAVIDVQPAEYARAVVKALREVRPDAGVLLLTDGTQDVDNPVDGTLSRPGRLRDVLRVDLEDELERLEAERRVHCLRGFVGDADVVPILVHPDPDPDAVSSALAVATLLGRPRDTPIVTLEPSTRPENRRMLELLHIDVTRVTLDELRTFERIITVDTQPRALQRDGSPLVAVIDHHPREDGWVAEFTDIRPQYGATATMMTEYLRALGERHMNTRLATALLFGIRTDTNSLTRGVTAADVEAYAYLQDHADRDLVQRFERPSYPLELARTYGRALQEAMCGDGTCVSWVGEVEDDQSHVLVDLADFCIGIEHVTWVVVGGDVDGKAVLVIRHAGGGEGAGALARLLTEHGGSGGGHRTMARATLPSDSLRAGTLEQATSALREMVVSAVDALV